jgi:hypothetical protein
MTKKEDGTAFVNPASLWGKPLPKMLQPTTTKGSKEPKKEKDSGMGRNESKDIDWDSDVDDELEVGGPSDAELLDDATAAETAVKKTLVEVSAAVSVDADDDDTEDEDEDEDDAEDEEEEEEEDVEAVVEDSAESDVDKADDDEVEPPRRSRTVSAKKSMSDYVRDEIDKRQSSGDSLRGVDIMNALAKRGVKVSAAQVSQLLKKAGVSAKARGPRKHKAAATPVEPGERSRMATSTRKTADKKPTGRIANKATPAISGALPVERLRAAKAFLAACGGTYEQAAKTLELHEQLQNVMCDIG